MAAGRTIGIALIGLIVGSIAGGLAGLLCGLVYTQLATISEFEGYSGFVVAYWILAGIMVGIVAGLIFGVRRAHR